MHPPLILHSYKEMIPMNFSISLDEKLILLVTSLFSVWSVEITDNVKIKLFSGRDGTIDAW